MRTLYLKYGNDKSLHSRWWVQFISLVSGSSDTVHAVRRRLLAVKARVRSQSGPCHFCDGQSHWASFLSEYLSFPLSITLYLWSVHTYIGRSVT
jgi:hypothetical protein